jgi:uncharacterized protein YwgA
MKEKVNEKDFLVAIYNFFESRKVKLTKILLQKAMYALDFVKEDTGFQFEAYHYGPFSRGLGELLAELRGDEKIKIDDNIVSFLDKQLKDREIPQAITEKAGKVLGPFFDNILERKTNFQAVELNGTVMYVMDVLELEKGDGKVPDIGEVQEEVKKWKWLKFNEDEIRHAYDRIRSYMWTLRGECGLV